MKTLIKKLTGTALAAVLSLTIAAAAQVADVMTVKPLQAVSFKVESKHAVGYFLNDDGTCKLVVTLADAPGAADAARFIATRYEATIEPGKTARFDVAEGRALDFACQAEAQTMIVTGLEQIAASPPGR